MAYLQSSANREIIIPLAGRADAGHYSKTIHGHATSHAMQGCTAGRGMRCAKRKTDRPHTLTHSHGLRILPEMTRGRYAARTTQRGNRRRGSGASIKETASAASIRFKRSRAP